MILALDVGNSQIYGGVFESGRMLFQFRKSSKQGNSSDELGMFLRSVFRENDADPKLVRHIALCSVVPDLVHSLKNACLKYFDIQPFILQAGAKTGLKIRYRNPLEVGADRIANAIAGTHLFPQQNLIIVDFGTATTYCAISAERDYLGGVIMPGFRISMEALESKTAKLPAVEILAPEEVVGRSTVESIQSGLYYGNLYALQGITRRIRRDCFDDANTVVLGTGGFSRLLEKEKCFDHLIPDLVLIGLVRALEINL
jgi:type III pantothenate kinase